MENRFQSHRRFEEVVKSLLISKGFQPLNSISNRAAAKDLGFDLEAKYLNDTWLIEIRYYRTEKAQASLLESSAAQLASIVFSNRKTKGMLIVSCTVPFELRNRLEIRFGLAIADRSDLLSWAEKSNDFDELNSLFEEERPQAREETNIKPSREISELKSSRPSRAPERDTQGTMLCHELHGLKKGKRHWAAYEQLCDRVLRYLFPNDLNGWHKQKRTDDGLNKFDYVCRINPTTEFWRFLIENLNSRYILFEFKNYSGEIKQGQILTTEKYLLDKGLRRVAIILSRRGGDKGARLSTQGAMRENGKLMLILSDKEICEMLHMKERGEDPTDYLFEFADDFLLSLPR